MNVFLALMAPFLGLALALTASKYFKRQDDYYRLMAKLRRQMFPDAENYGYGPYFVRYSLKGQDHEITVYCMSKRAAQEQFSNLNQLHGKDLDKILLSSQYEFDWERW